MQLVLGAIDSALAVFRAGFFAVAAMIGVVCTLDWMVRTRRLGPFRPVARFMRARVDPFLAPVERRVVRAGGLPSSAPWWALIAVVLAGIILISLLDFVRGEIAYVVFAFQGGPTAIYRLVVSWTFGILQLALIVRVLLSWVSVRPGTWYGRWSYRLTEPILRPLRQVVPSVAMMDITPLVAWFLFVLLETFLLRLA